MHEADTCRRYVVPKLQDAGWEMEPHRIKERVTFTDGRIVVAGRSGRRRPGVPVPDYKKQPWFNRLQAKVREMIAAQQEATNEVNAMLPSVLDMAFKREL